MLISNKVDPIPTDVFAALTSTFNNNWVPVSVVSPMPNLDIPSTFKFSYVGSGMLIWGLIYPVPPDTILNANVPPAPTVAVIFAPFPPPPPAPTFTVIVSVVTAVIVKNTLLAGSVARGYGWLPKWLSLSHVKTNELVAIFILLLVLNPCDAIVSIRLPVAES